MEKNELPGIPDPDVVVSDDDKVNFIEWGNKIDLESSSSKHEQHQPNDTMINIPELDIHVPVDQCCIYKVPIGLRKINEDAYTPQVISIGPIHYGKKAFSEMEKQKTIYISEFKKREGAAEKSEEFKSFIRENERLICNYYHEYSYVKRRTFVNMIYRDAVFIIMFFLKNEQHETDSYLDRPNWKAAITRDLQLFENQLPYFLLKNLFEIGAFPNFTKEDYPGQDPFLILSHRFFFDPKDGVFPKPSNEIKHFTDLRRYFLLMDFLPQDQKQRGVVRDLPTATMLHESGVKFKIKGIEGRSSLDEISCKYVNRTMRIPRLGCEIRIPCTTALNLQIPCFEIDARTECLYRNIMALEQCHYPSETHICNFIRLMNFLIKTNEDVDLLVDQRIISSCPGDNAATVKMFNNLCLQITPSLSVYHKLAKTLKTHYDRHRRARCWNRTMATLSSEYFKDVWTGTATVAAFILLVLTFIQAVCSILSLL